MEIQFKQIAKMGFGRKNQLSPQCAHTWANGTGYTLVNYESHYAQQGVCHTHCGLAIYINLKVS